MLRFDPPRGTRMETLDLTAAELREFTDLSPPGEQDEWVAERVPHEVITWTAWEFSGGTNEPVKCHVRYVSPIQYDLSRRAVSESGEVLGLKE